MAHTSETRWGEVSKHIADVSNSFLDSITKSEALYQDLLELWAYAGGSDQAVADLLFNADPANATQVQMAADAKAAMLALHELYEAANNIAITQDDRVAALRRMS